MKRLVIPLASYLAVTIVVPVLNGAPVNAPFLEHAALVVTLTLTITGSLSLLSRPQRLVEHRLVLFVLRDRRRSC